MRNRTPERTARGPKIAPADIAFDNHLQIDVVQAARDAGIAVPHSISDFVDSEEPVPAAGNQWTIAMGKDPVRPGTSLGASEDRRVAHSRLDRLAEWAEETRSDDLFAVDIRENRQRVALLHENSSRSVAKRTEAGIHIDDATKVHVLQHIYRDPVAARIGMLKAIGDEGPAAVVDILKQQPEQFGQLHGKVRLGGVASLDLIAARTALADTTIPTLQKASATLEASDRMNENVAQMQRRMPVNHALLRFDDAVNAINRAFLDDKFAGVDADIKQHKRFEELLKTDPVSALELAQTKAEHDDKHGMWLAMAEGTAERVRENPSLRADASERGIDPDRVLKAQMPPPAPGPQRRRQP
jgi:hypothetical protein